jgi:hypothetical protein
MLLAFLLIIFNICNFNKTDYSRIYSRAGNPSYHIFNFSYTLVDILALAVVLIICLRVVQYTVFIQLFKKVGGPLYFSALFCSSLLTLIDLVLIYKLIFLMELAGNGRMLLTVIAVFFILVECLAIFKS